MPASLESFLVSGRAAELILLLVVAESLVLFLRYRGGTGAPPVQWLSPLLAGAALVIALRLSQAAASPALIGLALGVAGLAHLAGYRRRWYH